MHELVQCLLLGERDQFRDRFQSFLDQIPRPSGAGASPSRRGFFQGFFLGMFSSINDINVSTAFTQDNRRIDLQLNVCKVCFKVSHNRERDYDELHIAVFYTHNRERKLSRFVFLNNGCRQNISLEDQNVFISQNIGNIERLSCVIRIDIGRERSEVDISPLRVTIIENRFVPQVIRDHHVLSHGENRVNLQQLLLGMSQQINPQGNFLQDVIRSVRDNTNSFLRYATALYNQSLVQYNQSLNSYNARQGVRQPVQGNLFREEAFQHGYLTGMLMNTRYRLNLRPYVEIISGRGYADIILLVRGEERSFKSIPTIFELKRSRERINSAQMALQEALWYARALRMNKIRMLTDSTYINCAGIDMEGSEYFVNVLPQAVSNPSSPLLRRLINIAVSGIDEEIGEDGQPLLEGIEGIRTLIGEVYYGFPCTQDTHNHLSRFLLGQALVINRLRDETQLKIKVEYRDGISAFVALVDSFNSVEAVIFNIKERGRQNENLISDLPKLSSEFLNSNNVTTITEVNIRGYTHAIAGQGSPSPRRYFELDNTIEMTQYDNIEEYQMATAGRRYNLEDDSMTTLSLEVGHQITQQFESAMLYQHQELRDALNDRLGVAQGPIPIALNESYRNFVLSLSDLIRRIPHRIVSHEHEFKAIMDGLLTALSDLKLFQDRSINVIVVPEFQVGGGRRVDLAIQTIEMIENNEGRVCYQNGVLVLMELKLYRSRGEADNNFLLLTPQGQASQLLSYIRSKNLKALTDGREVVILGVALIGGHRERRYEMHVSTWSGNPTFVAGRVTHSSLQEVTVDPLEQRLGRGS